MELTLDAVLYKLRDLSPEVVSGSVNRRLFSGARHISYYNSAALRSNLCVGFLSEALAVKNAGDAVYLCVCDLKNGAETAAASGRNIVLFSDQCRLEYLFDRVLEVFEEIKDWDKALHVGSLEGRGLDYLVQISETQIANPMLIFDPSFNLLEHTHTIQTDYVFFNETVQNGYSPVAVINRLTDSGLFKRLYSSDAPIIHQAAGSDAGTNIYFKLTCGGMILGFASVLCGAQTPSPGYVDLLILFFENVNLYFRQYFYPNRAGNFMYESFLQNLISGNPVETLQAEAQSLYIKGINANSVYRLLLLYIPGKTALPLSFLAKELSGLRPEFKPFLHDGSIYILREYPNERSAECRNDAAELASIEAVLSQTSVVVAYSGVFFAITDLPAAKAQCEAALRFGLTSDRCLYYEDYRFSHMMETVSASLPLESFLSSRYLRLARYDEENGTELCRLLHCHFSCFMRTSDTAKKLFLHRNTVLNRLNKIEELLGCSLLDDAVRQDLELSVRIAEYLAK